jgi:hypothetical protein
MNFENGRRFFCGGVAAATLLLLSAVPASADIDAAKLRGLARGFAERTFVYQPNLGVHGHGRHKRRFALRGQLPYTVKASDGSLVTAFQATLSSSVDGSGDIVLLFHEEQFLGWASRFMAVNLGLGRRGNAILVRYAVYRPRDAFCCPSGRRAVAYRWENSRIIRSGDAPRHVFGEHPARLHMSSEE